MTGKQRRLRAIRTLVQEMGWHDFMMEIGSIMAEQSDKTDGSQSSAMFACADLTHRMNEVWKGCGTFEYPSDMVDVHPNDAPEATS